MAIRGGFEIATAYVDLVLDKDSAKRGVRELPHDLGPDADKSGKDTGDIISRGIRMSITRNSPLIMAAIAGGLTAGAPLLLGAATALFSGIAIVAAAQSQQVRSAWLGTWGAIRDGAIADSRVIVPTLVNLADRVQSRFEAMRPALRDIFREAGPQIDVFADGVMRLAENALPGMQRAIERNMPVIDGLATFLDRTGTGLTRAFDAMSEHAGAAGSAAGMLGTTMEELLAVLGETLGVGAELATGVLPLLNHSLALTNDIVQMLGPVLPLIAQGFLAWRVARTAAGWIDDLVVKLDTFAARGGVGAASAGRMSTALQGVGRAIPFVGAALVVFGMQMEKNEANAKRWGQALLDGGAAARQATDEMKASILGMSGSWVDALEGPIGSIDKMVSKVPILGKLWGSYAETSADAQNRAKEAADRLWESMDAGERAQQRVRTAQSQLNDAIDRYGAGSGPATYAAAKLGEAQSAAAKLANDQELAIRGVTEAMIAMVDQGRSMVDATFAQEDALKKVNEAALEYLAAVRDHGKSSAEAAEKLQVLNEAYSAAGKSSRELAESNLPAAVDDQTRAYFGARAELEYYHSLLEKGIDLPQSMDDYVAILERQVGGAASSAAAQDVLRTAIEELGVAVTEVPGEKAVTISGRGTEELRQKLSDLGFQIERIPGTTEYKITADDKESEDALTNLMAKLAEVDIATAKPNIDVEGTGPALSDIESVTAALLGIDGVTASPNIDAQSDVETQTNADLEDLLGLGGTTVTPTTDGQSNVPDMTARDLNLLTNLGQQRPQPTADLLQGPFAASLGSIMDRIRTLAGQRPTPTADIWSGPFDTKAGQLFGTLGNINAQRPAPTATLFADTWAAETAINQTARPRSTTITVNYATHGAPGVVPMLATGGPIGRKTGGPVFAATGKIVGPGGPFDDLIRAIGPFGSDYRVSNGEWIVNALASARNGERKMQALNDGLASIVMNEELRRPQVGVPMSVGSGVSITPDAAGGATISVGALHVHVQGIFDFTKPMETRRLGQQLQAILADLERERR